MEWHIVAFHVRCFSVTFPSKVRLSSWVTQSAFLWLVEDPSVSKQNKTDLWYQAENVLCDAGGVVTYCASNHHVFHFLFFQEFTGWVFSCFCFVLFHSFIIGEVIISNENLLCFFFKKLSRRGIFLVLLGWGWGSGLVLVLVVEPLLLSLAVWMGVKTEPNSSSAVWWKAKGKQTEVTSRENPIRYCE